MRNCIKQYARSNMHFILQKSESVCNHVITDKQWLWENLLCLASNSVKYIGDGGEIVFRVALETSSNCLSSSGPSKTPSLLFEVEDDGVGIPDKEMTALFQPFKQAQRNAGGTGLGLFALANRALAIGGHYGVRRRRDDRAGVLFWFTIPYRPDHTIALEEELHSNDVEIFKEDYPSKSISIDSVRESISISGESEQKASKDIGVRILLVEDSFMIQKATTRMLRNIGHSADIANNGMECLQRLSEKRYDLILMDINMPVMDGLQTIQRIRADESASSIDSQISGKFKKQLVIGVSADSDTSTRETALNAGMDDFLEKPLDIATLKKKCISHSISL